MEYYLCGDCLPLAEIGRKVPVGRLDSPPTLQSLIDALAFDGPHARVLNAIHSAPEYRWLDSRHSEFVSPQSGRVQSGVMKVLRPPVSDSFLEGFVAQKLVVTFGVEFGHATTVPFSCWSGLGGILDCLKVFLRVCWLKTVAGA